MTEVEEKEVPVKVSKKRRIIQVAKEFHLSVDSVVESLREAGFEVKNQMSPLTPKMYDLLSLHFGSDVVQVSDELSDDPDVLRKDREALKEKERLEDVSKKLKMLSEEKPPSLDEVQKEAIKKEKEEEKKRLAAAKKAKQEKEDEKKKAETKKKEEEAKRLEEEEKKKAETEKRQKEQESRRLERLLAHSVKEDSGEGGRSEATRKIVSKKEVKEPSVESAVVEGVEATKDAPVEGKADSEAKPESEEKKKRKKRKDRIAEEKQKAAQKVAGKSKKKKKKDKKPQVSEENVQAAIKKTMQAMEDKGKVKRKKHRATDGDVEDGEEVNLIKVSEFISVAELAQAMSVEPNDVIKVCMGLGLFVSINQRLDMDAIEMVADEFEFDVEKEEVYGANVIDELEEEADDPEKLKERPPIVTIMGHVDHGKTSLLDYIRNSNIIAGEMGGITQHIGAYVVDVEGKKVTFLDTPGHEAFTAMRARGAQITDIVVLVVAADDRVMPQTIEAINHARAANVPIIIAINKIDKTNANTDLIKKQLSEIDILVEEWGGKYSAVEISAKTGENIDNLMELLVLQAELLEVKANPDRLARGVIIESQLDKGRGPVATILVQNGTLKIGAPVIAGPIFGKVRAMFDERGKPVKKAAPSTPVQVLGFTDIPMTGDIFNNMKTDKDAREISVKRQQLKREQDFRRTTSITLDEFSKRMRNRSMKELKLIVKADVAGSVEALSDSLIKLTNDEVKVDVIHKGVGAITESDVLLASASEAIIIGFQIRPNAKAWDVAEAEKVDIRTYSIIYDAINDVKSALEGMLEPEEKEEMIGVAEVREVFRIPKIGSIAGSYVQSGKIIRNENVRVVREGKVIYEGNVDSLKRFKDDAKEVQSGYECGIGVENFNDIKVGDFLESFKIVQIKRVIAAS